MRICDENTCLEKGEADIEVIFGSDLRKRLQLCPFHFEEIKKQFDYPGRYWNKKVKK